MDNKGIMDGLRRGEKECFKPRIGDADLWMKMWEELHELVVVAHVIAYRTKKEKEKMTKFGRFVTEGNEKAGAMMDEGFMAEARAGTVKQEREEVYVALQNVAGFHCFVEEWKDCAELALVTAKRKVEFCRQEEGERMKHRTEWCAEANRYRCMRCGRGSKYMKMPGKCDGPKFFLSKRLGKWEKASSGRT